MPAEVLRAVVDDDGSREVAADLREVLDVISSIFLHQINIIRGDVTYYVRLGRRAGHHQARCSLAGIEPVKRQLLTWLKIRGSKL